MNPFPNGSNFKFAKGSSGNTKCSSEAQILPALKFLNIDLGKNSQSSYFYELKENGGLVILIQLNVDVKLLSCAELEKS